ncbi:MAG: hypothetical protein EON57_14760, partial [Alphaproteobacteria bacterium]
MAVTKAQMVVWALIAGLGVWGCSALSRVTISNSGPASPAVATVMTETATTARVVTPAAIAEDLPATIPEFPFPDDLATATIGDPKPVATGMVTAFAEIPSDAIPQIATVAIVGVATAEEPPAEPTAEPEAMVAATEEPPIPMPSRPMAARPVEAVPLDEVKT